MKTAGASGCRAKSCPGRPRRASSQSATRRAVSARQRPRSTWPRHWRAAGLNVLVIDIDPQGNASTALGVEHHAEIDSIYDVLINDLPLKEVIAPCTDVANLICAPATIHLAGAEIELVSLVAREQRLRRAIDVYAREREKAGAAAAGLHFHRLPAEPRPADRQCVRRRTRSADPDPVRVLRTRGPEPAAQEHRDDPEAPERGSGCFHDPADHVRRPHQPRGAGRSGGARALPEQVLSAVVPRSVRISEAPSYQQTVITYDPNSSGALSYQEAAAEIAERAG